ncbi:MAG: RtcB family protein [Deltaproteobacteria bacterium]|nr:RtcB family protein [Deltaproteobacteria bacterium]
MAGRQDHKSESGSSYVLFEGDDSRVPVKAWVRGVPLEDEARQQLLNVARLPFVYKWVAAMPDVHWGLGATIGSVIPTQGALIPAAVGVDLGCGMMAVKTSLHRSDVPAKLSGIRRAIERNVPHGRTHHGGAKDEGSYRRASAPGEKAWRKLRQGYERIVASHPRLDRGKTLEHLGTLGSGNHFIEICLDKEDAVWVMLHSGSRGVGNRIGSHFISLAKKGLGKRLAELPDPALAYFEEDSPLFDDYVHAVQWAQAFAHKNRELMMDAVLDALHGNPKLPKFKAPLESVNCHHNYVARETHYGREVLVTRKGAVRAQAGELGIIPGSMGARSFIVRGLGNPESFESCSHGAGRTMSRRKAKRRFTVEDHKRATEGIECRKDDTVLDETPGAYKSIDSVMRAQRDLVEVVYELRQIVCVKG